MLTTNLESSNIRRGKKKKKKTRKQNKTKNQPKIWVGV